MPKNASRITYYPSALPGAEDFGPQATSSADREWCALVTALASWQANGKPKAVDKSSGLWGPEIRCFEEEWGCEPEPTEVGKMFHRLLANCDVDWIMANRWAESINRQWTMEEPVTTIADNEGTEFTLDDYQVQVLLKSQLYGMIYDLDTGLGKTLTSLCAALTVAKCIPAARSRCWILCPLNAKGAWAPYILALEETFAEVRIVSIDSAHKLLGHSVRGGVLICDECHNLGDPKARRTNAVLELRKTFTSGFCLTGSLLHGSIEKCLSIHDIALPGSAIFASKWKCGEYFNVLVRKSLGGRTITELEKPAKASRDSFFRYLSRTVVSLDKKDQDLRDQIGLGQIDQELVTVKVCEPWTPMVDLTAEVALALWDEAQEKWEAEGRELEDRRAMLRQLALTAPKADKGLELAFHELQSDEDEWKKGAQFPHMAKVAHKLARLGAAEKLEWLIENLDDEELPIVIFANYTETIAVLREACESSGISYVVIDGEVDEDERIILNQRFQAGEVDIFIGQSVAASVAMNLFRACISIAFDFSWRADVYYQCLGRTYRRGQTRDCLHVDLVANDLQLAILTRLRDAMDFDASCSEWQKGKEILKEISYG